MQSLNFGFLASHDERLVMLGALAERYFRDDPSTAIVKLCQFTELLAKLPESPNVNAGEGGACCSTSCTPITCIRRCIKNCLIRYRR